MNNPLGVSPSKGNQGTTRGEEKSFDLGGNRTHDLRIRSTVTLPTELRGRTEKVGDDLGGESRRRESKVTRDSWLGLRPRELSRRNRERIHRLFENEKKQQSHTAALLTI